MTTGLKGGRLSVRSEICSEDYTLRLTMVFQADTKSVHRMLTQRMRGKFYEKIQALTGNLKKGDETYNQGPGINQLNTPKQADGSPYRYQGRPSSDSGSTSSPTEYIKQRRSVRQRQQPGRHGRRDHGNQASDEEDDEEEGDDEAEDAVEGVEDDDELSV